MGGENFFEGSDEVTEGRRGWRGATEFRGTEGRSEVASSSYYISAAELISKVDPPDQCWDLSDAPRCHRPACEKQSALAGCLRRLCARRKGFGRSDYPRPARTPKNRACPHWTPRG